MKLTTINTGRLVRSASYILFVLIASIGIGLAGATTIPITVRKEDMNPEVKIELVEKKQEEASELEDEYKF